MLHDLKLGLEPPARLLVHSHWTVDDQKMSKSKNNVIDPNKVAEKYTHEGLRYFLLREGVAHSDGSKYFCMSFSSSAVKFEYTDAYHNFTFRLQQLKSNTYNQR